MNFKCEYQYGYTDMKNNFLGTIIGHNIRKYKKLTLLLFFNCISMKLLSHFTYK